MAQPVKKLRVGLYPGTFDPVTNGHLDVIARAARAITSRWPLVTGSNVPGYRPTRSFFAG